MLYAYEGKCADSGSGRAYVCVWVGEILDALPELSFTLKQSNLYRALRKLFTATLSCSRGQQVPRAVRRSFQRGVRYKSSNRSLSVASRLSLTS